MHKSSDVLILTTRCNSVAYSFILFTVCCDWLNILIIALNKHFVNVLFCWGRFKDMDRPTIKNKYFMNAHNCILYIFRVKGSVPG